MKIVRLGSSFYNCPAPWQNMIRHLQSVTDTADLDVQYDVIDRELAKYGGHYRQNFCRMEFETAAEYTMFALRWT